MNTMGNQYTVQIRSNYIDWDMVNINREIFEDSIRSAFSFMAEPSTSLPERPEHAEVEISIVIRRPLLTQAQ